MNGILIVNKEAGYTSRDIVNIVSKKFNTSRVGHTGTLDPIATGVLGIAIGDALKLVDQLTQEDKEYIATVKLGISTDTLDVTGNILETVDEYEIKKEILLQVLNSFLGKSIQEVPIYSAVKVNGKRLYEYAREGIEVEIPKREIEIFHIELLELKDDEFSFKVKVSKGTYIRSLIRDIGKRIGIPCTMKNLIRIKQGNFKIEDSYTIDDIEKGKCNLVSMLDCLTDFEIIEVDSFLSEKILNGRILENRYIKEKIAFVDKNSALLAIYKVYDKDISKVKPIKVFNNKR